MTKKAYHRVSTLKQETENGIHQLKELGIDELNIYHEKISGKSKNNREQLKALISTLKDGDEVYVLKIDRLARSLTDLNEIINDINKKGASIHFISENLTFENKDNPMNNLMLNLIGAFAEFERSIILNRMNEGKQYKLQNDPDFKLGRKPKYSKKQLDHATQLLTDNSYSEVEKLTGISKSTLIRHKRKQKQTPNT